MDVEYEDCSSELVTAPETEIACHDVSMEDSSDSKDTKRPSEEVKLQLEDDTQIKNYTEEGQSELALHDSQEEDEIAGRLIKMPNMSVHFKSNPDRRVSKHK